MEAAARVPNWSSKFHFPPGAEAKSRRSRAGLSQRPLPRWEDQAGQSFTGYRGDADLFGLALRRSTTHLS